MNTFSFSFAGTQFEALPSGGLWWPSQRCLVVSDLHLGKSDRIARRGGGLLPPYDTADTLAALESAIGWTGAARVVCLGDSFDDLAAGRDLDGAAKLRLTQMMAGRHWVWIEGNHDPGPLDLGGSHIAELRLGPLVLRHIAENGPGPEISGHYHPKATVSIRGRRITRACFLRDRLRLILPAFGTYTGGLRLSDPVFQDIMDDDARAILVGQTPCEIPAFGQIRPTRATASR